MTAKLMKGRLAVVDSAGRETVLYDPYPHSHCQICDAAEKAGTYDPKKATQRAYHASTLPNLLALGSRGTGKSLELRNDAILRCLMIPNFPALIVRRTMPELRRSHLAYIGYEMKMLGGEFLSTTNIAKFPNGSTITFGHCESHSDVLNYLSAQYGFIGFDELSTFALDMFLEITSSARAAIDAPYQAVVRASSNTLGIGSQWMRSFFVTKDVRLEDFPDYDPDDYGMMFSTLQENPHLDREKYARRLKNLPEHIRRAWLLGEFITEGQYFMDFHPTQDGKPWHVLDTLPTLHGKPIFEYPWLSIYRAVDWGFFPDPAVCLWIAVLPNHRHLVFKEMSWTRTIATDVAKAIKKASTGMHIVETFADPTLFIKTGETEYSIGDLFEQHGVALTPAVNKRDLYGDAIHTALNTLIHLDDGTDVPQLQILAPVGGYGCPELLRTLPTMQMDRTNPRKIAAGEDHWICALAYHASGSAVPATDPVTTTVPRWMMKKRRPAARLIV